MHARTRIRSLAAAVALGATLAACGGGGNGGEDAPSRTVRISGFLFSPETITVPAGATVTWSNRDDIEHTVTAGTPDAPSGAFDSRDVGKGGTFSHPFGSAGTFSYFCDNHEGMRGEIRVT